MPGLSPIAGGCCSQCCGESNTGSCSSWPSSRTVTTGTPSTAISQVPQPSQRSGSGFTGSAPYPGSWESWLRCQHQALLRSPPLWALLREQLLSGGTGRCSSCPPSPQHGGAAGRRQSSSPKPGQAKLPHNRVLSDHQAPPAAAFSFSAKPTVFQRQQILTSLLFPGSPLTPWEESPTQKWHRRDRLRAELDPVIRSPPVSSGDLDSHTMERCLCLSQASPCSPRQGEEGAAPHVLDPTQPGLLSLQAQPEPSDSSQCIPALSLPLLGPGRDEMQDPIRNQ